MPLKITKSIRIFIILLITVFVSNTVYAGGMMAAEQFSSTSSIETHHHEGSLKSPSAHEHHSHDDSDTSDHCSKFTHCIACISAITSEVMQDMTSDLYQAPTSLFEFQYVSIIIPLLQKPPISV